MRHRLRLPAALLGGVLLLAGTACGSGDDPARAAPPSAPTTSTSTSPSSPTSPTSTVPSPESTPTGAAPQRDGLRAVIGRWDTVVKETGRTFSLFINSDGSVRSLEPGERNSAGTIVPTGPDTYQITSSETRRTPGPPANLKLSADGRTLTVMLEGESIVYTRG